MTASPSLFLFNSFLLPLFFSFPTHRFSCLDAISLTVCTTAIVILKGNKSILSKGKFSTRFVNIIKL